MVHLPANLHFLQIEELPLGAGEKFSLIDADGDKVSLKLAKGGMMELQIRQGNAAPNVQLFDIEAGSSALSGKVKKSKTGDGRVAIASLAGTFGVDLTNLRRCAPAVVTDCLDIGVVAVAVVDRLLDDGVHPRDGLVQELLSV